MPLPLSVNTRLGSTIKKFRFEELESAVLPTFPEVTWNYIRSRLIKKHESFTTINALRIIEEAVKKANLSAKVLSERIGNLEVIEVSRHPNKRTWYTFMMKGRNTEDKQFIENREMQAKIAQNFRVNQMDVDVRIASENDIIYISVKEKPRGKEPKRMLPIFFALFERQEYLFCTKKNVTKECLQIIADCYNYTNIKAVKLVGKDLESLMKMLWMKKQALVNSANGETPKLENLQPVVTSSGIDFRQSKHRREYAERCFGEEPPTLELLVSTGPEQPWSNEEVRRRIPDEKVQIRWEFRSHNIATTFTKLAERRVFVMPLPQYVSDLMKTGKNQLMLREN